MDYILAIDQGTHASRALVFDHRGRTVTSQLLDVDLTRRRPGYAEQDAGQILDSVRQVTAQALQALSPAQRRAVGACGLTTQRSTVLAWRRDGTPLSPALSWQDTRGAVQVDDLKPRADSIRRISGLPLSAHYGASKLHWLNHAYGGGDDLWLGPLAAFLLHNLADRERCRVDHSNAQRMQLLDIHTRDWSPALLGWFAVPGDRLPGCTPVISDYGQLAGCGIPVTAVCGDQNAAWFGNGTAQEDTALINLGSGAFILAMQAQRAVAPELLTSIAVSDAHDCRFLAEATVNGAGSALQWLQQHYAGGDIHAHLPAWLDEETSPPLFINSVGGLGSPWWENRLEPAFHPERATHTLAARAVAVAESIVFLLKANLELLQRQGPVKCLRVSGGLSRIGQLCQKLADLAGLPVTRCGDSEASARGVAWLAAGRPGHWATTDGAQHFQPQPDSPLHDRYRRFREHLQLQLETCPHE